MKIITLLTDFGLKGSYSAVMKGVILSTNPGATVIDITHEIDPQDVREAAFLIEEYYRFFPAGTIHVAVVDPTVGSDRKPIAIIKDGYVFVGPDNGIFTLIIAEESVIYEIQEKSLMLKEVSHTFHGRDVFAPVAAHLAAGLDPSSLGNPLKHPVLLNSIFPEVRNGILQGQVIRFDRFGNVITNIRQDTLERFSQGRAMAIMLRDVVFQQINRSYYEQQLTCLIGSSGYLEFGLFKGSFRGQYHIQKDEAVTVTYR